tara:strand:- start:418 stop:681 length:264 start_codon:yes stop_codon:yes gene_type:complete
MKKNKIFEECETLAESMGFKVIHGKGNFTGDICTLEDQKIIVLNKNKPLEQRIKRFLSIFTQLDLSNFYLKPIIRDLIDKEKNEIQP